MGALPQVKLWMAIWVCVVGVVGVGGYSKTPKQYHIQTDEGPDRYFRFQTYNGQFRKEKRFDDGTVVGTYGWVDPLGLLRLYDYIADHLGYRIVRQRTMQVPPVVEPPSPAPQRPFQRRPVSRPRQSVTRPQTPVTQPQLVSRPVPAVTQLQQQQQQLPATQTQPVTQLLPPTHLRPATPLRPVPQPVQASGGDNFVPQRIRPSPKPSLVRQPPKLRPVLVPLSQTGSLRPKVVELQPVSPKPQPFTTGFSSVTPIPLLPLSNEVNFGKDFTGRSVSTSPVFQEVVPSSTEQFFGEDTTPRQEETFGVKTNAVGSRRRFRGKPLALRRRPAANRKEEDPTAAPTASALPSPAGNRGSIRFRGAPVSSGDGSNRPQLLQPVKLAEKDEASASGFGSTTSGSFKSVVSPSPGDNDESRIKKNVRRQRQHTGAGFSASSNGAGDLTSQGTTNSGVTFDMPADLPYSINYDLGNQFHFEKVLPDGTKVGKHGYVDPLGVLRVTLYSSGPQGHHQKHDNKWVGTRDPEDLLK